MVAPIATVFGGTGFVGRSVVQSLVEEGYTVRVPTRDVERAQDLKVMGIVGQVIPIRTSVRTDMGVLSALTGSDLVINLIGAASQNKKNSFQFLHVEVVARIARLARTVGVKRFVHFSAIGAHPNARIAFLRTKALGEDAVRAFFPDAVIMRPSVIYGPRDRFLNRMALFVRHIFYAPLIDGGKTRFQPIYVGDVAQAVVNACILTNSKGAVYALAGPDIYSFKDLWLLIERLYKKSRWMLSVPLKLAYIKAFILELWLWPPFKRDHLHLLKVDWVYKPNEVRSIKSLGVHPRALEKVLGTYLPF